ncbi:cellulose biosynthesis protein BcsD [Novosphingobium terrae]|uniref:cellulose biosynthesis protein BcsD n=1 Tax=Novosphingobium terrae TaxID=2726189 RepID=UPI00198213CA|nr:hypothetical protein [Novosphingobium terrae]
MRLAYQTTGEDLAMEEAAASQSIAPPVKAPDPSAYGRALLATLVMSEVFDAALPAQAQGFYRAVGKRLAAHHPIPHMQDLRELQRAANAVWEQLGLGHADITLEVQGVVIRQMGFPPAIEGDKVNHWGTALPALLEGAYDGWLRSLGSPEALVTRVTAQSADRIEIRHGALADG